MKTIFEHIEQVQRKPRHIRKRIAFATAATGTAIIALLWLVGNLSIGTFAIRGSTFAESTRQWGIAATGNNNDSQNLAGAAAALPAGKQGLEDANAPAHIKIIDAISSTSQKQAEQTILPF
ncbi:hypothetical protein COZ83_01715 [Candidatus Kaiserbacteria bacterium CG_4_8_14_3_um_filter_50_23]|uniref:Uncharacterized protein n=1 Tax=Candidatus Kaiserbacteria bacterium CG17_big_fil_post_rev_8_21_14_2_50_51_7 TaxID=1974613 RepID=A0A2M7FE89_9BACT|nr:MAG: hypothetical protein COW49_00285 [Candidatus Kaiserbacteria bacterium CG17_big_fil_post_rev_8_21_14_2_50_51_7]PIW96274.1 MAG: hypothetical protein COZ83_01715 [Candidatus Kaiserbacteria bacterium CG_4_8_14_3_um_filter_50_23]